MTLNQEIFEINADDLTDCKNEVLKSAGYDPSSCDTHIIQALDELHAEALRHMHIQCGFMHFRASQLQFHVNSINCRDVRLNCGATIAGQMHRSTELAVFAVTLGNEFDHWSRGLFSTGDPFSGYFADLIGSIRVEQAADKLEVLIGNQVKNTGLCLTNRFSPGYCGWDVYEQHTLFSLLPNDFLNIKLTDSALMIPIKSISGIIGLGTEVKKEAYSCKFCEMNDCFMRRTRVQIQKKERI